MDFSDALRDMKQGYKVYRRVWRENGNAHVYSAHCRIETLELNGQPILPQMVVEHSDGKVFSFACSQWDILSDDWEVVKGDG